MELGALADLHRHHEGALPAVRRPQPEPGELGGQHFALGGLDALREGAVAQLQVTAPPKRAQHRDAVGVELQQGQRLVRVVPGHCVAGLPLHDVLFRGNHEAPLRLRKRGVLLRVNRAAPFALDANKFHEGRGHLRQLSLGLQQGLAHAILFGAEQTTRDGGHLRYQLHLQHRAGQPLFPRHRPPPKFGLAQRDTLLVGAHVDAMRLRQCFRCGLCQRGGGLALHAQPHVAETSPPADAERAANALARQCGEQNTTRDGGEPEPALDGDGVCPGDCEALAGAAAEKPRLNAAGGHVFDAGALDHGLLLLLRHGVHDGVVLGIVVLRQPYHASRLVVVVVAAVPAFAVFVAIVTRGRGGAGRVLLLALFSFSPTRTSHGRFLLPRLLAPLLAPLRAPLRFTMVVPLLRALQVRHGHGRRGRVRRIRFAWLCVVATAGGPFRAFLPCTAATALTRGGGRR